MNYNVRKFLSKIEVYLCAVMLLNVISPCISFATDSNMANIENDTSINEYVHTLYGTVYSKYILDENNNLSKNLFLNDACISEGIIDFCVDNQYIAYSSGDSLYLYDFQDGTSDNICTDVQLRDLMLYSNYIYGVNDSEGLSQLYVIDSGNKELIKTNYTNVNAFTISDDGLNIDMKLPASKLEEIGTDKIDVSTYSAIADSEEINYSDKGLDNILNNSDNNISLFSAENVDMPVLMATVTLSSLQPAMFVMDTLYVTQGAYGSYSHSGDNAFDLDGSLGGGEAKVYAPFDGVVKYKETNYNTVWLESNNIVQYADGRTGYLTVLFMHDNDISNIYQGQTLHQGQYFYDEGGKGPNGSSQYATHLHLECIDGTAGSYAWHKRGNVYPNDALYLYSNTNVQNKGGYTWRTWSGSIQPEAPIIDSSSGKAIISWNDNYNSVKYNVRIKDLNGTSYDIWNVIEQSVQIVLPIGSYTVYIDYIRETDYISSIFTNFDISVTYDGPTESELYVDTTGNSVNMTWENSINAEGYHVRIFDINGTDYSLWNQTNTYSSLVLPIGSYYAYVDSYNGDKVTKGKKIAFTVTQSYLDIGKATPNVSVINGKTFISWNESKNATKYNVRIKNANGVSYDIWNLIEIEAQTVLPIGSYTVYIDSVNDYGYVCGNSIDFSVNETYIGPSTSDLQVDTSGNLVNLTWSTAINSSGYNIRIANENGIDYTIWSQTGNDATIALPLGTYYAYVDSYNGDEVTKGKKITFTVTQSYLDIGKATPNVSVTNGKTFITWNGCKNASKYNVRIKDANGISYDIWNLTEFETQTVLPVGAYSVYIDSVNDYGYICGGTVYFDVKEMAVSLDSNGGHLTSSNIVIVNDSTYGDLPIPIKKGYIFKGWYTSKENGTQITSETKVNELFATTLYAQWEKLIPYTDSIVTKNGQSFYVNVVPVNIEESCEIIVAAYKGGKFVTLTSTPYNQIAISTTLLGDIDEIKVMVWNSLSGLRPLCDAEVIPSGEFIIE